MCVAILPTTHHSKSNWAIRGLNRVLAENGLQYLFSSSNFVVFALLNQA